MCNRDGNGVGFSDFELYAYCSVKEPKTNTYVKRGGREDNLLISICLLQVLHRRYIGRNNLTNLIRLVNIP